MPIGSERGKDMTEEQLDEIWAKYGKLDKKKMRKLTTRN